MAMQTFNDELDEIQTPVTASVVATKPAAVTASAQAVVQAAVKQVEEDTSPAPPATLTDNENLDTDFDDKRIYDRPGQLNQCRPEKGKAARFAFVPKEWIAPQAAKGHFTEQPGKDGKIIKQRSRCLTSMSPDAAPMICCQKLGKDGEVSIVALVVRYMNADATDGKYVKDASGNYPKVEFEIQFVRLSQFNMKQIKKLPDEDKTPFLIDIVMTHSEGRAFGYEFNRKANSPRWQADLEVAEQVKQAVQKFVKDGGKALRSKLGTKLNEIEWRALLSGVKSGNESKIENVEEL